MKTKTLFLKFAFKEEGENEDLESFDHNQTIDFPVF